MIDGRVIQDYREAFGEDPVDSYLGMELNDLEAAMQVAIDRGSALSPAEILEATGGWDGKVPEGVFA